MNITKQKKSYVTSKAGFRRCAVSAFGYWGYSFFTRQLPCCEEAQAASGGQVMLPHLLAVPAELPADGHQQLPAKVLGHFRTCSHGQPQLIAAQGRAQGSRHWAAARLSWALQSSRSQNREQRKWCPFPDLWRYDCHRTLLIWYIYFNMITTVSVNFGTVSYVATDKWKLILIWKVFIPCEEELKAQGWICHYKFLEKESLKQYDKNMKLLEEKMVLTFLN